jgi:hypothetical protein
MHTSHAHPLLHTLPSTPSRSHPPFDTLSFTPSLRHPLVHTLPSTPSRSQVMHKSEIEYKFQMCNQICARGSPRGGSHRLPTHASGSTLSSGGAHARVAPSAVIYKNVAQAIPPPFNLALVLPQLIGEFCCSCGGLTSAGSRRRRNLTAVGPREGTASDDNHANHVAASMFVEQYLQTVEEEEQASQHGLSVATHNAARHLERGQAEHADLLLDMQAQLKKMGSAMAEMSEKRDEIPAWAHAMNEGLSELKAQMAQMAARAKPAPVEASPAETTRERGETTLFARSPAAGHSSAAQEPAAPPTAQQQDPGSRRSMLQSVEGASVRRWV